MNELLYIYEIYRQKSFSLAAKKLFVTQPALSAAVKKTEEKLGITVFNRSASPITLTEEGRVYMDYVERVLSETENMKTRISDISGLKTGSVAVCGESFVSSFILPEIIMRFTEKYPGIKTTLTELNSPDLLRLILSEQSDLLISHTFDRSLFDTESLFYERILLAVPESFAVNKKLSGSAMTREQVLDCDFADYDRSAVSVKHFRKEPFLLVKAGNDMNYRAAKIFSHAGVSPVCKMEFDQLITAYNSACFGMGVAFCTDVLVKNTEQTGCVFYPVAGEDTVREMLIGYKKNRYLSAAASAFIKTAKECYKKESVL